MRSEPANRSPDESGRLGAYPTGDGDITDVGRRRQIVVAAWVLGWLGGPLPALMAIVVTRPAAGSFRRQLIAATCFWAGAALSALILLVVLSDQSSRLVVCWATWSATCLIVTAVAVSRALRLD